jgi:hypothetical protein
MINQSFFLFAFVLLFAFILLEKFASQVNYAIAEEPKEWIASGWLSFIFLYNFCNVFNSYLIIYEDPLSILTLNWLLSLRLFLSLLLMKLLMS